jgi:predicted transcriptional regulator
VSNVNKRNSPMEAIMRTSTVTTRIDEKTKEKLEQLSKATERSKSFLISEAIREYIIEQAWQIDAIKEGIDQADAKKFASTDEIKSTFSKWGVDVEEY